MMEGRLVALSRPTDRDYELFEEWLAPSGQLAALTGDLNADVTAEQLKQANGQNGRRFYTVRRRTDAEPIGTVNSRGEGPGCYSLGGGAGDPALWRAGYVADAFLVLVTHLFHDRNARRVEAVASSFNRSSMQMLAKAGFVCEGILRKKVYLDGSWHDSVLWAMLREEFYHGLIARQTRISDRFAVADRVPEEEKQAARRALAGHLRGAAAATSIDQFLNGASAGADPAGASRAAEA